MATSRLDVGSAPASAESAAESAFLEDLIARIEVECPRRASASAAEHHAQEILGDEFAARGLEVEERAFRFSKNLYAVLALHCAIATLGSACYLWQPLIGAALHGFAAIAYVVDCHYRGYWLRRLVPWGTSHNLIARIPTDDDIQQRIVLVAHADAAPTGWMFHPSFLKLVHAPWPNKFCLLRKQMLASTLALCLLALLDVTRHLTGYWFPFLYYGLTLGSLIPLVLLTQILVKNRIVPGANDNLSGCAALVVMADRLMMRPLPNTEVVFVVTGCEEAGRGGAWTLEREMRGVWDPKTTTIIGLDTLSGGDLRYHVEGEILPIYPSQRLQTAVKEVADSDARFSDIAPYHAPAGATDVAPFIWKGYDGMCVTRIHPRTDIPPNYHVLSDTAANINGDDIRDAVDFTEMLVRRLASSEVQVVMAARQAPAPPAR